MPENKTFYSLLTSAMSLLNRRDWIDSREINLSTGQPKVLLLLKDNQGLLQKEIASCCMVKPATMTVLLKNMEKSGLIRKEKIISKAGKKAYSIYLTDEGEKKAKAVESSFNTIENEAFTDISMQDKNNFFTMIEKISQNLMNELENKEPVQQSPDKAIQQKQKVEVFDYKETY